MRAWTVLSPSPSPSASYAPDPFAPDPTIWPEAPSWLFPSVMTAAGVVLVAITVLLVLWRRSIVIERRARAARPTTEWVDLSKLNKRGRWEDHGPTLDEPDSPQPPDAPNRG